MELQNTLENKAKVFALYWGQKVLRAHTTQGTKVVGGMDYGIYRDQFLELKPISSISDEDASEVLQLCLNKVFIDDVKYFEVNRDFQNNGIIKVVSLNRRKEYNSPYIEIDLVTGDIYFSKFEEINDLVNTVCEIVDYLRSKGYALPDFGLSVEELVNRGWIVLEK